MDAQVGKVLDELDRLGLRENTIVVLWGDHGWKLGEHDAWCKHSNCENDTNGALLLSAPGMRQRGLHSRSIVEFVDIYPTLADLAGLPLPSHLEGLSFKPLLADPNRPWKQAAFSQYPRRQRGRNLMGYSMRTERYRFTVWVGRNDHSKVEAIELYDHTTDPQENQNLAKRPEHAALVARLLSDVLDQMHEEVCARIGHEPPQKTLIDVMPAPLRSCHGFPGNASCAKLPVGPPPGPS